MVDVITPTITVHENGRRKFIYANFAAIDGAGEYGIIDILGQDIDFMPNCCTCIVARTSGTTTTIDVDVDIGWDGTNYQATDCNNIVAYDAYKHNPAAGAADDNVNYRPRYWRVLVVDEGSGNVNEVKLWLYEG